MFHSSPYDIELYCDQYDLDHIAAAYDMLWGHHASDAQRRAASIGRDDCSQLEPDGLLVAVQWAQRDTFRSGKTRDMGGGMRIHVRPR